jgi:hypothetical protein
MKILEEARLRITAELPNCKTHDDVLKIFTEVQATLSTSRAAYMQKQRMWNGVKENLSRLSRRPDVVNDAHAIIDNILKHAK